MTYVSTGQLQEATATTGSIINDEIKPIADNTIGATPNCRVDKRDLQTLIVIIKSTGSAVVTDLNRHCANDGVHTCPSASPHCMMTVDSDGLTSSSALDIGATGDGQLNGANAATLNVRNMIKAIVPHVVATGFNSAGADTGQSNCSTANLDSPYFYSFSDTCNHQHVDYRGNSQALTFQGVSGGVNGVSPLVLPGGQISLYTIRGDGNLWGTSQQVAGGSFGPWQIIGTSVGDLTGRPAIVQTPSGLIAAYARTSSGTIVGTSQGSSGGSFGAWQPIGTAGGGIASAPAAIVLQSGVIAIYATTDANTVAGVAQSSAGGSFGAWQTIGTTSGVGLNLRPSVLQASDGRIVLYAHSLDNRIFGTAQAHTGSDFGTWVAIGTAGGGVVSEPAVTIDQNDRISVYASAGNGTLAGVSQPSAGASFGAWVNYGSGPVSLVGTTPALVPLGNGSNALYALGEGSTVWGSVIAVGQTGPSGWAQIGSGTGPSTAVTGKRTPAGQIVLYGNDASGHVVGSGQAQINGPFSAWTILG